MKSITSLDEWATLVYGQFHSGIVLTLQGDGPEIDERLWIASGKDSELSETKIKLFGKRYC